MFAQLKASAAHRSRRAPVDVYPLHGALDAEAGVWPQMIAKLVKHNSKNYDTSIATYDIVFMGV